MIASSKRAPTQAQRTPGVDLKGVGPKEGGAEADEAGDAVRVGWIPSLGTKHRDRDRGFILVQRWNKVVNHVSGPVHRTPRPQVLPGIHQHVWTVRLGGWCVRARGRWSKGTA